jgi:hypothetical protein
MTRRSVALRKVPLRIALSVVTVACALAVLYLLLWYGPDLIAKHDIGAVTGPLRTLRLQQARDAARGRLLTLGAGLFAAGALVYTALNFRLSREGQVTDRYTRAIEQLGSDKLEVRIGGIYALERIARDSARDHPAVMEVLSALIREHSREQLPPSEGGDVARRPATRPDVQAAATVIGRRDSTRDRYPINLTGASLVRAGLHGANLVGAGLYAVDLTGAGLRGKHFRGAYLTDAPLWNAHLAGADLTGADLIGADLSGADLIGVNLTGAKLTGAVFSEDAPVPDGWVRDPASGRLHRAGEGAGDAGN